MKRLLNKQSFSGYVVQTLTALFLFCLIEQPVTGQTETAERRPDSLKSLLAHESGTGRVDLLIEMSHANWNFGLGESLDYATSAYELARELNYEAGVADALNRIGNVHYFLGNHSMAIENYNEAYDIAKSLGDSRRMGMFINNTGLLYNSLHKYDSSEVCLIKALRAKEKHGDKKLIATTLNNLGVLYRNKQQFDLALDYFSMQLAIFEEAGETRSLAVNHRQIGEILFFQEKYAESLKHLRHSLNYAKDDLILVSLANYNIARSLLGSGETELALETINRNMELLPGLDSGHLLNNYDLLFQYHKAKGDYKPALEYKVRAGNLKDSLRTANSTGQYLQLEQIFETQKQNDNIELLQKEKKVRELLLVKQHNIKLLLILLLSILVIFILIIAYRFRLIQKTNKLLKQKVLDLEVTNKKLSNSSSVLEQLNATKNRFFSIIAHDLKNPFNSLLGFSEIITDNFDQLEEKEIREYISIVHLSSQNLFKLLENLLKWSASQTGTMHYLPGKFDLAMLINSEINFMLPLAVKKQIQILADLQDDLIINSDKILISCVLRNLIDNAVKFTHPGGKIMVSARKEGQEVYTQIHDNGIGIPPDIQSRLFQLDDATSRKGTNNEEGGGLGLILCRELIEKIEGTIGVESTGGQGSRFWFRLPFEEERIMVNGMNFLTT